MIYEIKRFLPSFLIFFISLLIVKLENNTTLFVYILILATSFEKGEKC